MKKHLIYNFIISTSLMVSMNACKTTHDVHKLKITDATKTRSVQEKMSPVSEKIRVAQELIRRQGACTDSVGCLLENNDFCNHPHCPVAILFCHTINFQTFCTLTDNMTSGYATFTNAEIAAVLDGAECGNHWVKCYIKKRWPMADVFTIETVDSPAIGTLYFETIYSIPLLKTIYDAGVISIDLYQGVQTSENGTKYNVIPIKVNYANGTIGYYDVSNDLP